jgi:type VI secretion system protein ImpC
MGDSEQAQAQAAQEAEVAEGSLLASILEETDVKKTDQDAYAQASAGMKALLAELLPKPGAKADKAAIDMMISMLDGKLSGQIDEILHNEQFQRLESAWRGLRLVVERTNFRENVKIELLNCSKSDLLEDFENEMDITKTGLYKTSYTAEYGTFGGKPYGAIIANYDFGAGSQDMALLQKCASVATMAHAPFIAAADKAFFGSKDLTSLPNLKDIKSILEGPLYTKWNSFRETEDSRYVGLTLPRFLLRLPYGKETVPVKSFDYQEKVTDSHDKYLWGNTAFAFATRLTDAFAKSRWCPNIIGPQSGGAMEDLPLHHFESMGEIATKIPTEVLISERREFELAEEGFIPLTMRKGSDNACFFSANSCQKPKNFGQSKEGKEAETNYRLGTQLPYLFVISRLAHYIKVIQRENLGSSKERVDLDRELNEWIRQYVADMDAPSPGVRARRPLRAASITVEDVEGQPGWYKVDMKVRPHFKYMGAFFTLSLVGKLDKK